MKFTLRMLNPQAQLGVLTDGQATFADVVNRQLANRDVLAGIWARYGVVEPTFYGSGHHWMSHPQHFADPWLVMGYVAGNRPGMHVNSGFIQLPLFSPLDVAEKVVTIDQLTGGRFTLVAGLGWREAEFQAVGATVQERVSRFEESIELCRALWSGEPVDVAGHYTTVRGRLGTLPIQRPHPPVVIGAQGPAGARRAARIADGLNVSWVMSHDSYRRINDAYRDELAKRNRPAPRYWALSKFISVDDDADRAHKRLDRMATMFDWYSGATTWVPSSVEVKISREEESSKRTVAGSPESVREQLLPHLREYPYTDAILTWLAPGDDPAENREHFEYLCSQLLTPLMDDLGLPADRRVLRV
ncbi:LLM class flavin-dependent oxidoreductase [Dactylosporangium sp. CA-092794]|uniref:LLM class flavin-dependent oxidoreductase n=1 Tax=Dactylosporangium sp. CA-092794 TaxID=3239929 RepID=UPI003D8F8E0C